MKFCEECGAPLEDDAVFCEECGTKVVDSPEVINESQTKITSDNTNTINDSNNTAKNPSQNKSKIGVVIVCIFGGVILIAATIFATLYFSGNNKNGQVSEVVSGNSVSAGAVQLSPSPIPSPTIEPTDTPAPTENKKSETNKPAGGESEFDTINASEWENDYTDDEQYVLQLSIYDVTGQGFNYKLIDGDDEMLDDGYAEFENSESAIRYYDDNTYMSFERWDDGSICLTQDLGNQFNQWIFLPING